MEQHQSQIQKSLHQIIIIWCIGIKTNILKPKWSFEDYNFMSDCNILL